MLFKIGILRSHRFSCEGKNRERLRARSQSETRLTREITLTAVSSPNKDSIKSSQDCLLYELAVSTLP